MYNYSIVVGETTLDLPQSYGIQAEFNSPLLELTQQGSMTFPFTLPRSPTNDTVFGYASLLASRQGKYRSYDNAKLYFGSSRLMLGRLELRTVTTNGYTINLISTPGNISPDLLKTKITKLDLGSQTYATTTTATNLYSALLPDTAGRMEDEQVLILRITKDTVIKAEMQWTKNPERDRLSDESLLTLLAEDFNFNQTDATIRATAQGNNISIVHDGGPHAYQIERFLSPTTSQPLNVYSEHAFVRVSATQYTTMPEFTMAGFANYCFPTMYNPDFYTDVKGFGSTINAYDAVANGYYRNTERQPLRHNLVPMMFLGYIINQLAEIVGYTNDIYSEFMEHPAILNTIIYNINALDKQCEGTALPFNVHEPVFTYAKCLPELTISEFFDAIRLHFCLFIDFNSPSKKISIRSIKSILAATDKDDYTSRTAPYTATNYTDRKYYQLTSTLDGSDKLAKAETPAFDGYPAAATVAASDLEYTPIKSPISTLDIKAESTSITLGGSLFTSSSRVPKASQPGNSVFNKVKTNFTFRLLFYKLTDYDGVSFNGLGLYPSADNQWTNILDNKTYRLTWQGTGGLYEEWWKDYLRFLENTYEVEFTVVMKVYEIANFDYTRKVHISGLDYLVRRISAELRPGSPEVITKWTCWRVV